MYLIWFDLPLGVIPLSELPAPEQCLHRMPQIWPQRLRWLNTLTRATEFWSRKMLHQCSSHDVECMAPSVANIKFMNENLQHIFNEISMMRCKIILNSMICILLGFGKQSIKDSMTSIKHLTSHLVNYHPRYSHAI